MDAINIGLGTPEEPFDFEAERVLILKRIEEALRSGEVPRHLRTTELTETTRAGRKLSADERAEVEQYDAYIQKLYDTCEWKQCIQMLRDRLLRLPPQFNTYKLLIHAESNCGALDMAAKHAQEAYIWDALFGEAYIMMAKLDCMAMQPDRAEAWLALALMVPGTEEECGVQLKATRSKISELRIEVDKMLAEVTPLFCLPDFWVRLSKNVEYYRTFACEETRAIVSEVQKTPASLRVYLKHDKIQWLTSMLAWTSAPLTYEPPTDQQISLRHWRKVNASRTSTLMTLPIEILLNILDFVDPPSVGRLPQVCLFWRDLLTYDHRICKRLYLNMWDPPIIYHVPDWLWIHAYRQRYGLCITLARIWNRRDGDYAPTNPAYEANVRTFLSKFSFISPSFSESLSLVPDFIYGNVNHNLASIAGFDVHEVETSEEWPPLPYTWPPVSDTDVNDPSSSSDASSTGDRPHVASGSLRSSNATPTSAKADPEESEFLDTFFSFSVIHKKSQPEPQIDPRRKTLKKSIPVFSRNTNQSLFDSRILNVCYYILSRSNYGDETQQAAKSLSALAFHNAEIAHHLVMLGAVERFALFAAAEQSGEAADLVATLLLHRHGVAKEASESQHTATKIFPRLWTLGVVQDVKELQRWVAGLSGLWRGRFFLGTPGYDTCYAEHFLYLQFHPSKMNFGHFIPKKDLKLAIQDFRDHGKVKTEYRFNSKGYIPPDNSTSEDEDHDLFDDEGQGVQEGECRITGSGLDDFGPYTIVGRLNVVYKTIYLAKIYEFEPADTKVVYLGGDLGVWGMGGALKSTSNRNGVWKWWKDGHDYTLDEMHELRADAENNYLASVKWRLNRTRLRHRLRTGLTAKLAPNAPQGVLIGDEGMNQMAFVPNMTTPDPNALRQGLRWAELHTPLIDVLLDPVVPPLGADIAKYTGNSNVRPSFPGYVPARYQDAVSDEQFVWYDTSIDCGPMLQPINSLDDEKVRIEMLAQKPTGRLQTLMNDTHHAGHPDLLAMLIDFTGVLFQLEHMSESMHTLDTWERDILPYRRLRDFRSTPPIARFQGEADDIYIRRRMLFADYTELVDQHRFWMLLLHRKQALEDAAYLERTDIPATDPRKLHIVHRWVDDWLRHSVRMRITDPLTLQLKLIQVLRNPSHSPGCFAEDCMNPETEWELVYQVDKNKIPGQAEIGEPITSDNSEDDEVLEDEIVEDDELATEQKNTQSPQARQDNGSWFESGLAAVTFGLVLALGIYLAARNRP